MESQGMFWLIWLVKVACGVILVIKFRGTRTAVLGAIGFGLLIFMPILTNFLMWWGFGWYEYNFSFGLLQLAGWGCLFAAFLMIGAPSPASVTATSAGSPQPHGTGVADYQSPQAYHHPSVNKGFYLGSIMGGLGASLLLGAVGLMLVMDNEEEMAVPLLLLSFMASIYSVVILAMLIHRMWTTIQPGHPRSTPGKAVGFLFIPFFNFYWVFQAYWGWAQDYNRYVASQSIPAPRVSENTALTVSILCVCSIVPYLGILISLVNLVFLGMFLSQACDAMAALAMHAAPMGQATAQQP